MGVEINPLWIPVVALIAGPLMVVAIVATVFLFKARAMELQSHQDLRIREMEHLKKMKELEIEMEKAKAENYRNHAA